MRHYKVGKKYHTVYESSDELPDSIDIVPSWRDASIGDWVLADDECYIQILRKGVLKKPKGKKKDIEYVGTCTGTFANYKHTKMDTSRRENIFSFGGKKQNINSRMKINAFESLFVDYITSGMKPVEAYIKAFPTNNPTYAKMKSAELIKTTRVRKAMKKELEPVMKDLGISKRFVLGNIKALAESSEKEDTRLKALFKLSDILDLEDKATSKVQQITGVQFQGFSNEQLKSVKRPKEISANEQ